MLYISSGQPLAWSPNNESTCAKPFSLLFIVALILHWVQIQMWPAQFEWTTLQ